MKKLIVNADDFGLHTSVNEAVIKGFQEGCIRSASLMPTGSAVKEAADLARKNPALGIGIHLTLVAEKPLLAPEMVPTLVNEKGFFWPNHIEFIKRYITGRISLSEVRAECEAQIGAVMQLGLNITHLDSHQHLHVLPGIFSLCLELAQKYHIRHMRLPQEKAFFSGGFSAPWSRKIARDGLSACAFLAGSYWRCHGISLPDHFFGMLAGGHMTEKNFLAILTDLPEGISEIMVHPGSDNILLSQKYNWQYHWQEELASVLSERAKIILLKDSIQLISFKELAYE